jgi:hypothetical protein
MAQLGEAIARYHKLLDDAGYRDLEWAAELQERMREQKLQDSGRLLAPVLRPQFLSRRQLDLLTSAAERVSTLLDTVAGYALESPPLLNRLKLLPAEKMLAAAGPAQSRFHVTARAEAIIQNGSISIRGLGACRPAGITCSDRLTELFLQLPIMKDFRRGKYKLSKFGSARRFHTAVVEAWKEFGGTGEPRIGIIELDRPSAESELFERLLQEAGYAVRIAPAAELIYDGKRLRAEDFVIDVALRCVSTRDLLVNLGLANPLFEAYRDRTVYVINGFRSEIGRRRALFELLTDDAVTARLDSADRKLIRSCVAWTRVIAPRKTMYKDREIDLLDFVLRNRDSLVLWPNEDGDAHPVFAGAAMTQAAWERALKLALQTPYVVQETGAPERACFPVFQYGELEMKEVEVSVHAGLFNGRVQGASALLQAPSPAGAAIVGAAPVLLLETVEKS